MFPFDNRVVSLSLTGASLRQMFVTQLQASRDLLGISGIRVQARCSNGSLAVSLLRASAADSDRTARGRHDRLPGNRLVVRSAGAAAGSQRRPAGEGRRSRLVAAPRRHAPRGATGRHRASAMDVPRDAANSVSGRPLTPVAYDRPPRETRGPAFRARARASRRRQRATRRCRRPSRWRAASRASCSHADHGWRERRRAPRRHDRRSPRRRRATAVGKRSVR